MPIASVLNIFRIIKDRGPVSRTDLQQITTLSWGTITNTTRELLRRKFIREQGSLSTKAGRKPVQLALNPASHTLLGMEIAPGRIHAILINLAGEILWHESAAFASDQPPEATLASAGQLARRGLNAAGIRTPMGLGLVLPGPVDPVLGTLRSDAKLPGWKGLPIRRLLESHIQLPIHLEQHAKALALAHRWFGQAGADSDDFICIYLGDSVDLGIISGGDIFRGHTGMAGNFAHVSLDPNGPPCPSPGSCGNRGCVDAFCSAQAIMTAALRADAFATAPRTLDDLAALATAGNPSALNAFNRMGTHLGMGVATLIRLFDPAFFVLAGKTNAGASFFLPALERHLQDLNLGAKILISPFNENAPALGVCSLILQSAFHSDLASAPASDPLSA